MRERGLDGLRIAVDEAAPMYYVRAEQSYPPMRFIVSDNDMKNRYEQTMLMLSTLRHYGCESFTYSVMHGTHCHYCSAARALNDDGDDILGLELLKLL